MTVEEIERAFREHRTRVDAIFASGDWAPYADEFTAEATYRRTGHPEVVGREAIRTWVVTQMARFPADQIAALDVVWHVVDPEHRSVVYEMRSTMRDPGDGSVHSASTTTSLGYAGDGLWAWGVDVHSPRAYEELWRSWSEAARRCGTLELPVPLSPDSRISVRRS